MSASEASDKDTIEYDDVHAPNFKDGARDIQNQASHHGETATTHAPRQRWQSIVVVVFVGIIQRRKEYHGEGRNGEEAEALQRRWQ